MFLFIYFFEEHWATCGAREGRSERFLGLSLRMIFNFYIFNRRGACLYYREWNRPYNSFALDDQDEERKLVFGMLFSIKELVSRMKPPGAVDDGLHCLKTSTYTLHHLEILTGLRFVLNISLEQPPRVYVQRRHQDNCQPGHATCCRLALALGRIPGGARAGPTPLHSQVPAAFGHFGKCLQ